ncbi:helix-turn-helix domain-containing protein [Lentibacillus salinarum]|uniref:Helix-turn-helix domain-containing protein n=1 Tax=Lentibacillus salinarum TaxID=446820 RepID=A0ABW3ZWT4_9BACI
MYLNKQRTKQLMNKKSDGNYNKFARKLNVDPGQLHRILNSESNAGPKFLSKLAAYCLSENIDFNDYIFFEVPENPKKV